jgi:hypothetical protein
MNTMGSESITPGGYVRPPSSISLLVCRSSRIAGGYSLRTSCNIMVTSANTSSE